MKIRCKHLFTPKGEIRAIMNVENGKIEKFYPYDKNENVDIDTMDNWIIPGIIDTHNHGTMGYSLMSDTPNKELVVRGYLKGLASQGVTACLATATHELYSTIAEIINTKIDGAIPLGIHSEGPYLNRVGENGVDEPHPDIDLSYLQSMIDDAKGYLKLVAIAPELPNAKQAIEFLNKNNVRCSFAHSNADYIQAMNSFQWGISVVTHTANVMSGIHHRHMGGLGAALLCDDVYNELICDGLHVSNEMIKIMLRIKNDSFDKFLIISDNIPLSGAPTGKYTIPGIFDVSIDDNGYCLTDTGRLYGSTVPVIKGMKNLYNNCGIEMNNIIKMACFNPSVVYNAFNKGSLEVGKDADFVIITPSFDVLKTFREGQCIYDSQKDVDIFNFDFINNKKDL